MSSPRFVIGLDVGTTTARSFVYNVKGEVVGEAHSTLDIISPNPGWSEIDPEQLWQKVMEVLRDCISEAGVSASDISAIGISCQRATFTCWSAVTGKHFHNLVTWKDIRADRYVNEWNASLSMKALRFGGKFLYWCSRQARYKAAGILKLYNKMVTMRLAWMLDHVPGLRDAANRGEVMFGCVDSWILYKLTGKHLTEISNIAATGLYDPFTMQYAGWEFTMFNLPMSIMPKVVDSCGDHFGSTKPQLLGCPIPIKAILADQSASVFGSGCYKTGSAKITMGTGSFLDVVTAAPHASLNGLIPLVAWKIGQDTAFLAEGSVHDTGVMMSWAQSTGLFHNVDDTSDIAKGLNGNGGVYFVPGFHGLQAPVMDPSATAGFIGLSLVTTKEEMLRALLESIAFSQKQLVEAFLSETDYKFEKLVVDGGVARNDFILQMIANLTGLPVIRPDTVEMSVWGVASLAGLEVGMWRNKEELNKMRRKGDTFLRVREGNVINEYKMWLNACKRFTLWHQESEGNDYFVS